MKLADFSDARKEIFVLYGKTETEVKGDVLMLREWMNKLPHLPSEEISDDFLEICLLKNKWSIEKAKSKIEGYCTHKAAARYSYLFGKIPVPSEVVQFHAALPNLTKNCERVIVGRLRNIEKYDMLSFANGLLYVMEILARHDYSDGYIVICDFSEGFPRDLSLFRIDILTDYLNLALKGHSTRTKEIHMINRTAKILLNLAKPLLPSKLISRFIFHDNCDSLKDHIPAACLPKDYGGELKCLDGILADWDGIFEENADVLKKYINTKAIEQLRQADSGEDIMQGTFRKLDID